MTAAEQSWLSLQGQTLQRSFINSHHHRVFVPTSTSPSRINAAIPARANAQINPRINQSRLITGSWNALGGKGPPRTTQPSPKTNPCEHPWEQCPNWLQKFPKQTTLSYLLCTTDLYCVCSLSFSLLLLFQCNWNIWKLPLKASNQGFPLALMGVWSEISHLDWPLWEECTQKLSEV